MDVYQLQVFASVYRNRSFSKASRELNLTQPSVSTHVKKLEEELGVRLFDRVGRKTIPTREGDLLFARTEEVVQKLREIKSEVAGSGGVIEGQLTVGTGGTTGSYIVPRLAAEFRKLHPGILFQVEEKTSKEVAELISKGGLLLGVVDEQKEHDEVECLHLIEDELVLAAAPGFIKKKEITPLGLLSVPIIMRGEGTDSRKSMEKHHLMHRISLKALNVAAVLGSTDAVKEAVKSGMGVSVLSRFSIEDELKAGLLEEVRIKGVRMKRSVYVIANRKRTLPRHYAAFVEFVRKQFP